MDLLGTKKRKRKKNFNNEAHLALCSYFERYGIATAEFFKEYPKLQKMQGWSPNFEAQKGNAAEAKYTSRINAENIINGKSRRIERTDDIGETHHEKFDHVNVDKNGKPILDRDGNFTGGSQQKVHKSVKKYNDFYKTKVSRKGKTINYYEKYKGATLVVDSDHFDEIRNNWENEIKSLKQQEKRVRQNGKTDLANQHKEERERIEDCKSRLKDSKVSVDESLEARKSPLLSSVKDGLGVSHDAGVQSAKHGAFIGSTMSSAKNAKALLDGDKDVPEAVVDIAMDTGEATAKAYASGAAHATIGGALDSTGNQICKNLAKKSGPAAILQTGVILANQTALLFSGKITLTEFAENINQEGMTLASSITGGNLGAIAGTAIMPGIGTLVGGVVGGMVASLMSGALYSELKQSLQATKMSAERRKAIEKMCKHLIEQERLYREAAMAVFDEFLDEKETQIRAGFESIAISIQNGKSIHDGLVTFGKAFNLEVKFDSVADYKKHLNNVDVLKI